MQKVYAQISDGVILKVAPAPSGIGYGPDGLLHDYTEPQEAEDYLEHGGWVEVQNVDMPPITETYDYTLTYSIIEGTPTQVWTKRDLTIEEIGYKFKINNLEERIKTLELLILPPPPQPTSTTGIKTLTQWDGVWPNQQLLIENGLVYRNVSGVPLTASPSQFPGAASQWSHLWVQEILDSAPPTGPQPWKQPTGSSDAYKSGATVTHLGFTWTTNVDNNVWEPGVYGWVKI